MSGKPKIERLATLTQSCHRCSDNHVVLFRNRGFENWYCYGCLPHIHKSMDDLAEIMETRKVVVDLFPSQEARDT